MRREIIKGMSNSEYHASPGISNSGLSLLLDCPKRYWAKYLSGQTEKEDSKALLIGTAVHTLTLEFDRFYDNTIILPEDLDRRRTADKKFYEEALLTKKQLLKKEDFDLANAMAESLKSNKYFSKLIREGNTEDSLFWEEDGIILRSRPDFYNDVGVFEIKTTANAHPKIFSKSIAEYGYHRQAALQLDLIEKLTGKKRKHFCFLVVESKFPYISSIFRLDEAAIKQGKEEIEKAKLIYKKCLDKKEWPAYNEDIEDIYLPTWY